MTATRASTFFGKTTELVRTAKTATHLERIILQIVQYKVGLDALLHVAVLGYAVVMHISLDQILPSALVLLIASVPVALPATFTLTTPLGAQELARSGILVNCLSAGISVHRLLSVKCSQQQGIDKISTRYACFLI
jgi:H+-transporting ATPase